MQTHALVLGRQQARSIEGEQKSYTFLTLPLLWPGKILTMVRTGEDFLPHGTKQADAILVEVDPDSFRHGSSGYTADIEVLDVWTEEGAGETGADGREPEEAAG